MFDVTSAITLPPFIRVEALKRALRVRWECDLGYKC